MKIRKIKDKPQEVEFKDLNSGEFFVILGERTAIYEKLSDFFYRNIVSNAIIVEEFNILVYRIKSLTALV